MITIKYNSNPNNPKEFNHLGNRNQLISQDEKKFRKLDNAILFWFDCTLPITRLSDIDHREWVKQYNHIDITTVKAKELEEIEKYFTANILETEEA